jgi:hypothetical protein
MSIDKTPTPAGVLLDIHVYLTCDEGDSVFSLKGCSAFPTPENIQIGIDKAIAETKEVAAFDWRLMTVDEVVAYRHAQAAEETAARQRRQMHGDDEE